MANWTNGVNEDGLRVLFDKDEAYSAPGGKVLTFGPEQMVELYWDYTMFTTSTDTASTIIDWNTYVPDNSRIARVELVTTTEVDSASDNTVLNFGLISAVDHSTVVDYDGLVNSLPQASLLPAGERFTADYNAHNTYGGALLGTTITVPAVVSVYYETAAPTAGAGYIRVFYIPNIWTGTDAT